MDATDKAGQYREFKSWDNVGFAVETLETRAYFDAELA